jgi:photosystem II stability/assembly factor-like uncharacterized protein
MNRLLAMGLLSLCAGAFADAPAGPTLDRPAVAARAPERAVLLGAAQAGPAWVAVGERGIVVRSEDGGRHWTQAPVPVSVSLTAVRFLDERRGLAVGHGGTVLVTGDGGRSWRRCLDGRRIAAVAMADALARQDAAARAAAQRLADDGPDKPLLDALVLGPDRMLVVGAYGLALASGDGGGTWTSWSARLDNPQGLHLYAIRGRGERIVIAGEQGLVLASDDGGRSFRRLETPYKGSFFTLELTSDHEIVLAGLRGNVWRSADDGATWTKLALPMPASIVASQLAADGTLLLASQAGFVLARRGDAFEPVNREPLPSLTGLAAGRATELLALSVAGVAIVSAQP